MVCRKTQSCWHKVFLSSSGLDTIEKDSNSALYSICEYGNTSPVREFHHCLKCKLECHNLSVRKMRLRGTDEGMSVYSRQ